MFRNPSVGLSLIAPRLHLRLGSHQRPCLMAPTIDGASPEHHSAYEAEAVPLARWLHKGESENLEDAVLLKGNPTSFIFLVIIIIIKESIAEALTIHRTY
jgi:hypothetical protein